MLLMPCDHSLFQSHLHATRCYETVKKKNYKNAYCNCKHVYDAALYVIKAQD